jgi:hypothetical protein
MLGFQAISGLRPWVAGLAAVLLALPALATDAPPPRLGLPAACEIGRDCWLVNLVDLDPGPGRRDYRCGEATYDGHKGVDIAIRDLDAMQKGVAVLAAAPGIVKGVRDGMADRVPDETFRRTQRHRYCGNGVVIEHAGGWQTQYCHLRSGSVTVQAGDKVSQGRRLGFVGHSGMAEFPHVHLSLRQADKVVDPFLGAAPPTQPTCAAGPGALWTEAAGRALAGPMTALFNGGFAAERPKLPSIRKGLYHAKALSRRSPVLIFWVEAWWVRPGDKLSMTITDPDGDTVVEHASDLTKLQARRMAFAGTRRKGLYWDAGTYVGEAVLSRTVAGKAERFTARHQIILRD